jgi:hypothetical protein
MEHNNDGHLSKWDHIDLPLISPFRYNEIL